MIQEPKLSNYERGTLLGRGGQACVYKYVYPQTNETFAVKIHKLRSVNPYDRRLSAKEKEWATREILVTSGSSHTRLLKAHTTFQYFDGFALVMPYYELGTLCSVDASQTFSMVQKKEATRQILDALCDIHRMVRIHRDIKPDNILVQSLKPLNVIISDFGQVSLSDPTSMAGTHLYRAPEILTCGRMKQQYTDAVDIYSMGMLLLWLLGPGMVGSLIEYEQVWDENDHDQFVGSKITAAVECYTKGDLHHALVMAKSMTQFDPVKRPSAAACLQSQWLTSLDNTKPLVITKQLETASPRRSTRNRIPTERANSDQSPIKGCATRPLRVTKTKTKAKGGVANSARKNVKENLDAMDIDSL